MGESDFEIAVLPTDEIVVYNGPLGIAQISEVDCGGDIYGVFLADLERNSWEISATGA